MKVKVPQADGEITINRNGDVKTYSVTDGYVTVSKDDVDAFLGAVEGSKAASETRSGKE